VNTDEYLARCLDRCLSYERNDTWWRNEKRNMNAENVGTVPAKRSALSESLPLGVGVDLAGTQIRAAVLGGPTLLSRGGLFTEVHSLPDRVIPRFFQTV